tara:strand:- start:198 stop:872 length:675 start_codon:yes stop_codon:yes gene_type:complete
MISKSFWVGDPNDNVEMESFKQDYVSMEKISFKEAKKIIVKYHYSHAFPAAELCLGFYVKGKLNAVIVYGTSATSKMATSLPGKYLELVRLFSFDWAGKNMESYCISQSIKYIKKNHLDIKVLVSFADPEQGHNGAIYQATNWLYCGISQPDEWYIVDGEKIHPRSMVAKYGTRGKKKLKKLGIKYKRKKLHGKHRYIYILGKNKKENKKLKQELQYELLPYPR